MPEPSRIVACPTCKRTVHWAETSPYRPFCSERCRLIDFGAWADEGNVIPGDSAYDDVDLESLE